MLLIPALGLLLLMRSSTTEKQTPELTDKKSLSIVNSGIFALTPDAMGITFYIHLVNKLDVNLDIATRMWECCESYDKREVACSHMRLIGGYKGIICSGDSRNVTLFYPNLYVYNRKGECLVGVWYGYPNGTVKELKRKIKFDTTLSPHHIAPTIAAYYENESSRVRKCSFIDEDPLDKCRPVDCSRKYNGQRLYYSNVERRCLSASICGGSSNESKPRASDHRKTGLPDLVYSPEGNMCEHLEPIVIEKDIRTMNSGRSVDQDLHPSNEYDFIICHNGDKSNFTGRCNCHDGWSSTTNHIRPTTLKVHLCTVVSQTQKPAFEDILTELSDTYHFVVPRFVARFKRRFDFRFIAMLMPLVLVGSIILSTILPNVYKLKQEAKSTDTKVSKQKLYDDARSGKLKAKSGETDEDEDEDNRNENDFLSGESSQAKEVEITNKCQIYPKFSDTMNSSTYYADNINRYRPEISREKGRTSIGISTKKLNSFRSDDYNAGYSMPPREKRKYFGRFQHADKVPLLQEESRLRSHLADRTDTVYLTETSTIPVKVSEASRTSKMSGHTSCQKRRREESKKKSKSLALSKGFKRLTDVSSISKSMAQLTNSSLPTSDSVLYLDESGSATPSQTDGAN